MRIIRARSPTTRPQQRLSDADRARLGAYIAHFNARDFDAIRAMISDDVRLDVDSKARLSGKIATIPDFRHAAYAIDGAKYSV
jgi:hypothetical protein